jgi:hypothetical protein
MEFQNDYDHDEEENDELDYGQVAKEMNEMTDWLISMQPDPESFMRCGAMAMCHGRLCADDEDDREVSDDERDRFLEWMLRLHKDLFILKRIMAQENMSKFEPANYRPSIRKLTDTEEERIQKASEDDDEEDENN